LSRDEQLEYLSTPARFIGMLEESVRRSLKKIAKDAGLKLPDLDAPLGCHDRWTVHHVFRAHDEKVTESYFERYIDDPDQIISEAQLEKLAQKRRDIIALELRVFKHINRSK